MRYVGKTEKRPSVRLRGHFYKARSGDTRPVSNWIRKHAPANIRYVILDSIEDTGDERDLYLVEQEWISRMGTRQDAGLNLTDGGPGSTGMVFTPERKANIGAGRRGKPVSPEALAELRDNLSNQRKLTSQDLIEVKSQLWDGDSLSNVARAFGVSTSIISRISRGTAATDVPWPSDRPRVVRDKAFHQREAFRKRKESGVKRDPKSNQLKSFKHSPMKIRDVRYIRELSRNTRLMQKEIAEMLPEYVTTAIVGKIIRGERWAWVG